VLGRPGEQAEGKVHRGGVNGDGGGQLCSRARAREKQGGFYRPSALRGGFARASWPTGAMAWAWRRWATCGGRRPMAQGGSPAGELCASTNCTTFSLGDFEVFSEILENVPKVLG
jgi:hypothetical protein